LPSYEGIVPVSTDRKGKQMRNQVYIRIDKSAAFIAQLVREGVTFEAHQKYDDKDTMVITLTGGY